MEHPAFFWRKSEGVCLILLLFAGAAIRFWNVPYRYDSRDTDEPHYLTCGLQVFEGMTPVEEYAPAGPEAWFGWVHAGVLSARYMIWPTPEERQAPMVVRPYTAANHALFELYRDKSAMRVEFIIVNMVISLMAVAAGYGLGLNWGGIGGAILLGGLLAFVPILIEHASLAKSYSMAWSFGMIAIYFAAANRKIRDLTLSASFLGLAIGSRVEMLGLLPIPLILLWAPRASAVRFVRATLRYIAIVVMAALLAAPWLLTNLLGNLRAIASIRFGPTGAASWVDIRELVWNQGLLFVVILLFGAIGLTLGQTQPSPSEDPLTLERSRPWKWGLAVYVLFLLSTVCRGTGYGLRHHGPAILALLAISPLAIGLLMRRLPRIAWGMIAAAVLFPLAQCVRSITLFKAGAVGMDFTAWVETHVPPGTDVYVTKSFHDPLPTPESSNVIWDELSSPAAPVRKFEAGLAHFNVKNFAMPRALSEQNVLTERSGVREWYILGSRSEYAGPRFNLHVFNESPVFGLYDPVSSFNKTGGVLIWRLDDPPAGLLHAVKIWDAGKGKHASIYVSPDLQPRLSPGD